MDWNFECFEKELSFIGLTLTDHMKDQFSLYYNLLIEWNQTMNLTAITNFDEVVQKHFIDSVVLGAYMDLSKEISLIDVGTGAGFPGIPLKILFPDLDVVLVDSLNKRVKFLLEVVTQLKLQCTEIIHGRAEDLARQNKYREQFDLCVSRAVANLTSLSEYCLPFVKVGGLFISYKADDIEIEVKHAQNAIQLLGGKMERQERFKIFDYHRSLLFIKKISAIDKKYPRKAGLPTKQPLH